METPSEKDKLIRIDLSPEQTNHLRESLGRDVQAIQLTVEELEQRIAPRLASNQNETMLVG